MSTQVYFDEYNKYLPYATDLERKYIEKFQKIGNLGKVSQSFGVNIQAASEAIRRVKIRAIKAGFSPEHDMIHPVPAPYILKGTSTLYNKDGNVSAQWVKTKLDSDLQQAFIEQAIESITESLPRLEPIKGPAFGDATLCNLVTFTDYHMGMMARDYELKGGDWNCDLAEKMLVAAFDHLVSNAPAARKVIVNIQGDFLHFDGLLPATPTSGHILHSDGSFRHIVASSIRVIRRICEMALQSHPEVTVVFAEGNHDLTGSGIWLQEMFAAIYENEPRMTVHRSTIPFYSLEHGKVMLSVHHGHLKKKEDLPLLMAATFPEIWGRTTHRYCHTGHYHHTDEKEYSGMKIMQHSTLAAKDLHDVRGGYHSNREATLITYHSDFGHVARTIVTPEMLTL